MCSFQFRFLLTDCWSEFRSKITLTYSSTSKILRWTTHNIGFLNELAVVENIQNRTQLLYLPFILLSFRIIFISLATDLQFFSPPTKKITSLQLQTASRVHLTLTNDMI